MNETNALLSLTLALLTNFAPVVGIPPSDLPKTAQDLQKCVIGGTFDTDLHFIDRSGNAFWVSRGTVCRYRTPGSYKENTQSNPDFKGEATLDTNEVINLAVRTVDRLCLGTNPIAGISPK